MYNNYEQKLIDIECMHNMYCKNKCRLYYLVYNVKLARY